jgi:hypothetical protein
VAAGAGGGREELDVRGRRVAGATRRAGSSRTRTRLGVLPAANPFRCCGRPTDPASQWVGAAVAAELPGRADGVRGSPASHRNGSATVTPRAGEHAQSRRIPAMRGGRGHGRCHRGPTTRMADERKRARARRERGRGSSSSARSRPTTEHAPHLRNEIEHAIASADDFLVVDSERAISSDWSGRRLSGRTTFVFARPFQTGSSACSWTGHPRGHWATTSCTCQGAAARNASTPCVAPSKRNLRHADKGQLPTCSPLWSAGSSRTERMLPAGSVNQAIVGPLPRMMPLASVLRSGRS